jgi:hypothetical protein
LELLEMNAMVLVGRRVRFCSFKFQFLGFKMCIVCLCERVCSACVCAF